MHRALWKVSLVSLSVWMFMVCGCEPQSESAPPPEATNPPAEPASLSPDDKAIEIVDMMASGDFAGVTSTFDATMKAALPEAALQSTWNSLIQQTGPFKNRGNVRSTTEQGFDVVYVECVFEDATMSTKVVFNPVGEVTGLFIQKG